MSDLPAAIRAYAERMHRAIGSAHHVASPLGAWLVVALAASAADDPSFDQALACPASDAHASARALLANPHPALRLAAAVWHAVDSDPLQGWLATLGRDVEIGPMPKQIEADAWAGENTGGLIETFPVAVDQQTVLVLASAVACVISWQTHFRTSDAAELALPRAAGFDTMQRVLRTPEHVAQELIVDSAMGRLAVHAMPSTDADMLVVSVIGEPEVAAADVLTQAHVIATSMARRDPAPGQRSLFDLPLGAGHSWTIAEDTAMGSRDRERVVSLLPAWSASSEYALAGMPELGFAAASQALIALLSPGDYRLDAKQVTLARYTRTGFEAAAVTGVAMRAAAMFREHEIRVRTATIEFTHPYAVVAVAVDDSGGPWAGVPLFSAWVTRCDEAD